MNSSVLWNCSSSRDFMSSKKPGSFLPDFFSCCALQDDLMFYTHRKINTIVINSAKIP